LPHLRFPLDNVTPMPYSEHMTQVQYLIMRLSDDQGWFEQTLRTIAIALGINPWALRLSETILRASQHESEPVSRYPWGSPCRFVRTIDLTVHVVFPTMLEESHPTWATYLRTTSPRWGQTWRHW